MPNLPLLSTLVLAINLAIALASPTHAQVTSLFGDTHIDANTRWAFRALSPVTVSSPVVRLGDIIQPLVRDQAGWQRMSRAAVGLVPVSGETMVIQRDRLNQIMLAVEATPRVIDWHGPTEIRVEYRKQPPASMSPIRQTSAMLPIDASEPGGFDSQPALTPAETDRIVHWIDLAMKRFYPDVAEAYAVHVPEDQPAMGELRSMYGIANFVSTSPIDSGPVTFMTVARMAGSEIQTEIELHLTAHPKVVVPNRSLGRGHRITAADLELKPFPPDKVDQHSVVDIESLIGQEVRGNLRTGRPILRSDVGAPILIHRGDLIEIRVIGGGVNVTTNAKALGDGAASDLIEIETMNPRKRLVARVADHGTVEIVTRAPRVRE